MPMGMPYPKGDMAMGKKKMSMSEMMGVKPKGQVDKTKAVKKGGKKMPPFMKGK
jgi:hypothetical protein